MKRGDRLSASEVEAARGRRLSSVRLKDIEGNPLDAYKSNSIHAAYAVGRTSRPATLQYVEEPLPVIL